MSFYDRLIIKGSVLPENMFVYALKALYHIMFNTQMTNRKGVSS